MSEYHLTDVIFSHDPGNLPGYMFAFHPQYLRPQILREPKALIECALASGIKVLSDVHIHDVQLRVQAFSQSECACDDIWGRRS